MVFTIIIAFLSLMAIVVLHEFGHFILAKKFGVRVEEFGVGFPPRLFGKKVGETLYSLNLLPFGAFVKIYGEEENKEGPESVSQKPIWQRGLIVLGGVLSFWIIAAILLSIVMGLGARIAIDDEISQNLKDPKVQIAAVVPDSPADLSGLDVGDAIKEFSISNSQFPISKVKELQGLIEEHKGENV